MTAGFDGRQPAYTVCIHMKNGKHFTFTEVKNADLTDLLKAVSERTPNTMFFAESYEYVLTAPTDSVLFVESWLHGSIAIPPIPGPPRTCHKLVVGAAEG